MPRQPKPWFRRQTKCWMAQINRKQVKLHEGEDTPADRKIAKAKLTDLLTLRTKNPPPRARRRRSRQSSMPLSPTPAPTAAPTPTTTGNTTCRLEREYFRLYEEEVAAIFRHWAVGAGA